MKKTLLFICILLCANVLWAQKSLSVKGVVKDGLNKEPIAFCNIVLLEIQDSKKILAGNTTNQQGESIPA